MPKKSSQSLTQDLRISQVNSVLAHQLQIPLAGIKGAMEVLLSGDLGALADTQREYIQMALSNTEKVIMLVKDILDASRIEEHAFVLTPTIANLENLVRDVCTELSILAKAKNSTLSFISHGDIPPLEIDARKIHDVIKNLVYNAIRYNASKGDIAITLERKGDAVVCSVRDSGVGISNTDAPHIFQKFYRTKDAMELSPVGSGLGLFIAKAVIEESGGNIWFETEYGKGTTFHFSLPIRHTYGRKD